MQATSRKKKMKTPTSSSLSLLPAFLLFSCVISAAASSEDDFVDCLKLRIETPQVIYTPENPSYWSILLSSSHNLRPSTKTLVRPLAIVAPKYETHIQPTIYCSKQHGVLLRVRSGGHDYEGVSYASQTSFVPFFILDMRNFSSIIIDTNEQTAWIQAGATLGEVYYAIAQKSRTLGIVAGDCQTVGAGGLLAGGGTSFLSRKFGLATDQVIDARIVTADGRTLDRNTMGDNLFWALRGGGSSSFGVITAFKVKLVTVPEIVTVFNVTRTLEENASELVYQWQLFAPQADENLMLRVYTRSQISAQTGDRTVLVSFTAKYLGRADDLVQIMQNGFPQLGVVREDCTEMSWIESILFLRYPPNTPLEVLLNRTADRRIFQKGKSDFLRSPIPVGALQGIWDRLNEQDEHESQVLFFPFGGQLAQIPDDATAFPHRSGILYMIQYLVTWHSEIDTERHVNWVRELYHYMTPYVPSSPRLAYFNYRDLDLGLNNMTGNTSYYQASQWGMKYFNGNFLKLAWLKTRVDPANFFRNEQSIPSDLAMFPITAKASQ